MESMPYPLHPMLVHFPVALFVSAFLFELAGLVLKKDLMQRVALAVFCFAAMVTPLVYWSGHEEAEKMSLHHPVLEKHELFAGCVLWVSLAALPLLWFVHMKFPKYFTFVFVAVLLALAVFVILTGHFGGRMVYEYGIGMAK